MGTFMEKLKGKGIVADNEPKEEEHPEPVNAPPEEVPIEDALQLPVDVYQTDEQICLFAQIAGINIDSLDVSISGDNDVVTITGKARRPEYLIGDDRAEGEYSLEECSWGEFYRQIILPEEIDPEEAEAKTKDGILILILPLKGSKKNSIRMHVERLDT